MTIIKQTGVQSSGHMKNLRSYINDDRKVLVRDSLNMDGCTNPKRWAHHMWMPPTTSDTSGRAGRTGRLPTRSRHLPCSDGSNNGS